MNTDLSEKGIQILPRVYPRKSVVAGFSPHVLPAWCEQCTEQATAEAMISMDYVGMVGAIVRQRKSLSASGQSAGPQGEHDSWRFRQNH
jgi:hypothetical protein